MGSNLKDTFETHSDNLLYHKENLDAAFLKELRSHYFTYHTTLSKLFVSSYGNPSKLIMTWLCGSVSELNSFYEVVKHLEGIEETTR